MPEETFKNRLIMVVDDEERMARFIRLNLEHDGFQVVEAFRGMEAIQKLRDSLPDLIILDVMMPDLDGFEVLKMIRETSSRSRRQPEPPFRCTTFLTGHPKLMSMNSGA